MKHKVSALLKEEGNLALFLRKATNQNSGTSTRGVAPREGEEFQRKRKLPPATQWSQQYRAAGVYINRIEQLAENNQQLQPAAKPMDT